MFLGLRNDRAVIDDGAAGDAGRSVIDGYGGIDEVAVRVVMPDTQFGELARSAADRILVAFRACPAVVHWAEPAVHVVKGLVDLLIERKGVARRLGDPVARALRAWILDEGRSVEARGSFGRRRQRTLRQQRSVQTYQEEKGG